MADTAKKEEKIEETKPAETPVAPAPNPETTTANDGSISVNQDTSPVTPEQTPAKSDTVEPKTDAVEDSLIQTPTEPVIVSDADVVAAEKEVDPHQSLAEQIEVLTGEVQALEAKIERLTNGVGETPAPAVRESEKPVETEAAPIPPAPIEETKPEPSKEEDKQPEQLVPETPPQSPSTPSAPIAAAATNVTPVNDIYSKLMTNPSDQAPPAHKDLNDDTTIEEGISGIGTIGEVLIVFGFVALVILATSPLFKSMIGTSWEALKSIGWPTATISLALGFLLYLFNKKRIVVKIFALLLTLVAAVMTAAVFDYGSMLGPLSSLLDPIASFYK